MGEEHSRQRDEPAKVLRQKTACCIGVAARGPAWLG